MSGDTKTIVRHKGYVPSSCGGSGESNYGTDTGTVTFSTAQTIKLYANAFCPLQDRGSNGMVVELRLL